MPTKTHTWIHIEWSFCRLRSICIANMCILDAGIMSWQSSYRRTVGKKYTWTKVINRGCFTIFIKFCMMRLLGLLITNLSSHFSKNKIADINSGRFLEKCDWFWQSFVWWWGFNGRWQNFCTKTKIANNNFKEYSLTKKSEYSPSSKALVFFLLFSELSAEKNNWVTSF